MFGYVAGVETPQACRPAEATMLSGSVSVRQGNKEVSRGLAGQGRAPFSFLITTKSTA